MASLNILTYLFRITIFYYVLHPTKLEFASFSFKILTYITVSFINSSEITTGIFDCALLCGKSNCDYFDYDKLSRRCEYGISNQTYYNSMFNRTVGHKLYSNLLQPLIPIGGFPDSGLIGSTYPGYIMLNNVTQEKAKNECEMYGDKLVRIKSREDAELIRQFVADQAPDDHVWIDLKYNLTIQKYILDDGTQLYDNDSLWGVDEPDHEDVKLCVVFNDDEFLLDTKDCTNLNFPLCSVESLGPGFIVP